MAFKLYCLLLLVRFLWVFQPQPGYIHPDEFFQNPEPLAGDIFGYDVHRTWEFNKTQLTRSVFFPSLTSGISFLVLKTLSEADLLTITPALLLIFPRLAMVLCSLSTDFCIYNISKLLKFNPEKCLNIFASSYIVLVFCSRTFSNSIEVGVYALILLMVVDSRQKQLVPQAQSKKEKGKPPETEKPKGKGKSPGKGKGQGKNKGQNKGQNKPKETGTKHSKQEMSRQNLKNISAGFWLGVFLLEGFFNRPTIGLYALFPMLFWLTGNATSFGLSSLLTVVGNGLLILPGVLAHLLVHLILDSLYAGTLDVRFFTDIDFLVDNLNLDLWQNITLTPLNFIKYNLDVDNLSSHGIHPQVTHFFVNLPMLCLPLYVSFFTEVFAVYFSKGKASRPTFTSSTSRAFLGLCFFTPVLLISIFPHQEARFVMPAVIPLILLYSDFVTFQNGFPNVPWIAWNLLGCLVFGLLHQAGMIPCLAHINGMLVKQPSAEPVSHHVVFFHTYMPPRHLLMRSLESEGKGASELHIHDMMGSDRMSMLTKVDDLMESKRKRIPNEPRREVYVVAPASMDPIFCKKNVKNNFRLVESFFPHLSMEDPPLLFPSYKCMEQFERSPASMDGLGKLKFSFSLNMYKVERVVQFQPVTS